MRYAKICVAVALQRYLDLPPITLRQRELAMIMANSCECPLAVLSVDAPVELLPGVESTVDKLARFAKPLEEAGIEVTTHHRSGRPSREISDFVEAWGADLLIIGTHSKRGPLDVGLGSTASSLKRELKATVLMIRPTLEEQDGARELIIPRYPVIFPYG